MEKGKVTFRYAQEKDLKIILQFINKLAVHEGMPEAVKATERDIRIGLFEKKQAEVLFVLVDEKEVGFSLFFENFAAYTGKSGVFIDDLYIEPEYRGMGIGKLLIKKMAEITLERGGMRLEWLCLNENISAKKFYQHMGGHIAEGCVVFRATGLELKQMIEK